MIYNIHIKLVPVFFYASPLKVNYPLKKTTSFYLVTISKKCCTTDDVKSSSKKKKMQCLCGLTMHL